MINFIIYYQYFQKCYKLYCGTVIERYFKNFLKFLRGIKLLTLSILKCEILCISVRAYSLQRQLAPRALYIYLISTKNFLNIQIFKYFWNYMIYILNRRRALQFNIRIIKFYILSYTLSHSLYFISSKLVPRKIK